MNFKLRYYEYAWVEGTTMNINIWNDSCYFTSLIFTLSCQHTTDIILILSHPFMRMKYIYCVYIYDDLYCGIDIKTSTKIREVIFLPIPRSSLMSKVKVTITVLINIKSNQPVHSISLPGMLYLYLIRSK